MCRPGFSGPNNPNGTAQVILNGITLTDNGTGVLIRDANSFTSFGAAATFQNGVVVSGGTTGLEVLGSKTAINGNTLSDTSFSGQSGNYIALVSGALHGTEINATASKFDGSTGAAKSLADNFATEDKIVHAVDDASLGFIRVKAGQVFVTPNSFNAPNTTTASIQRGVDIASSGDTVNVEDGTYVGQVDIAKNLTLLGQSEPGTIIESPATLDLSNSFTFSGRVHQSVIAVTGGNVTIDTLTIDGAGAGNTVVGGNDFHGIGIHDADATVQNVIVTGVRDGGIGGVLTGVQRGRAIFAGNDAGSHTVTVTGNSVLDYQKNGVDLRGTGLTGIITNNTITGVGPTGAIAQNGIVILGGVQSTISGNTIKNNAYTGSDYATAILLYGAGPSTVSNNLNLDDNQLGIAVTSGSTGVTISGNKVTGSKAAVYVDASTAKIQRQYAAWL